MAEFDLEKLAAKDRYKLLTSLVVPRPIALVTTIDENGVVNAAPFSFFNLMGSDPPVIALGIARDASRPRGLKDTARNLESSGEFVVHIVTEDNAAQMNICAVDFPPGSSEVEAAGFHLLPSTKLKTPRLAEVPAQLECRFHSVVEIRNTRVTLGEVVHLHLADEFYDPAKGYVLTDKIKIIGRVHGADAYTRTQDILRFKRDSFAEWQAKQKTE